MSNYYLQTDAEQPVLVQASQVSHKDHGTDFLDDAGELVAHAVHSASLDIVRDTPLKVSAFFTTT
jgi:hypothetical protein